MGDAVDRALSENHALIAAILEHHNSGRHVPAVALLERLQMNLEFVAAVAEHGAPAAGPPPPQLHMRLAAGAPPMGAPPMTPAQQAAAAQAAAATAPQPPLVGVPRPLFVQAAAPARIAPALPGVVGAGVAVGAVAKGSSYWTKAEHARFENAMRVHGSSGKDGKVNFKGVAEMVGTRTAVQVRSHLQKVQKRLGRQGDGEDEGAVAPDRTRDGAGGGGAGASEGGRPGDGV